MMSMFRYCEKGWKWLFLTMIALSVVACGDDTDDFSGSAVWRTSSTVGAAEGSAAIFAVCGGGIEAR